MRLAHLILAHANPHQVVRLVNKLLYAEAHVYLHIDRKADIRSFLILNTLPNVYFIKKRHSIRWGGYSMVEATLSGFAQIASSGQRYDYINLLSGQDYPLQKAENIHRFLEQHPGKAFMEYLLVREEWQEAIPRLYKYHLAYYRFPGWNFFQRWINHYTGQRRMPSNMEVVGRSQWFTITGEQMHYILQFIQRHRSVSRFFKLTWGADEFIFQTILYNSPYRENIVNNNLRLIDWSGGGVSPKTFTLADEKALFRSGKLYARKFSPAPDDPVLQMIDTKLLTINNRFFSPLAEA